MSQTNRPKMSLNLDKATLNLSTSELIQSIRNRSFKVPNFFSQRYNSPAIMLTNEERDASSPTNLSKTPVSTKQRYCSLPQLSIHRNPHSTFSVKEIRNLYSKPIKICLRRKLQQCYYPKSLRYQKPDWNRLENHLKNEGTKFYHLTENGTINLLQSQQVHIKY